MKSKPKIAIVRGKFLNAYEMQFYEPLTDKYRITAFGSLHPIADHFKFPVVKLASPMDLPEFPFKMPILNRLFIDAHYLFGLETKLKGFDLVHSAETYYHYTQQALNAKKKGYVKKVIATVLENIPFNNEGIWGRKRFKERARRELDHIIALTNKTKDILIEEGTNPSKITVISHFIDTNRFRPTENQQAKIEDNQLRDINILFCGRLEEYKGVLDILSAAAILINDPNLANYRIKFTFVGDGTLRGYMINREKELGITQIITHLNLSYEEMPRIYQSAQIYLAPSKSTPTWEEQYNTSLMEAQASGLPIITTRSGGIPENVADAAVLIDPGDVAALAFKLRQLITSSQMRSIYALKARNRAVTVHDIHIGAHKLDALYRKVLMQK